MIPTSHVIDPVPPRLVRVNHVALATSTSEDSRREISRKRYGHCTRGALGRADLDAEGGPVYRPFGREATQRRREADIDVFQVANLRRDRPRRASRTEESDAANVRLHNQSARLTPIFRINKFMLRSDAPSRGSLGQSTIHARARAPGSLSPESSSIPARRWANTPR